MHRRLIAGIVLAVSFSFCGHLQAARPSPKQGATVPKKADKKKQEDDKAPKSKSKLKPFKEIVKDCDVIKGLFTFYRHPETNKTFMEIQPDQLDVTFLCSVVRERGDAHKYDSAALLTNFPFRFQRVGERIHFVHHNLYFRADDNAAMRQALERDMADGFIAGAKFASRKHPERDSILIDVAPLFIRDVADVAKGVPGAKLDDDNSTIHRVRAYPANAEIQAQLLFKGAKEKLPTVPGKNFSHLYHYSLSSIPDSDYQPRLADPRVGHFTVQYQDFNTAERQDPYVRNIKRWHLEKQDPTLPLSPPKDPIVFWLENTIPAEYRDAVRRGALLWNDAFEQIGYQDAIVVKDMPEDADWEPADARYNVIRWIVKPGVGLGVGPSHAHPLTGEIYSADIRITAGWVRSVFRTYQREIIPRLDADADEDHHQCRHGYHAAADAAFAWDAAVLRSKANGTEPPVPATYVNDFLTDLLVHEVGHTLGLRHNFKGSFAYTQAQLDDPEFTAKHGTSTSVMDYVPVNLAAPGKPQGRYWMNKLGPYDVWAIEYAYGDPKAGQSEADYLATVAGRASEPLLAFGTDQDASTSKGIDPSCYRHDLGDNAVAFRERRIAIAMEAWEHVENLPPESGDAYGHARRIFDRGLWQYRASIPSIVRHVGGIYHRRYHEASGPAPFEPVPAELQHAALDYLVNHVFAVSGSRFQPELLNKLQPPFFSTFRKAAYGDRIDYPVHQVIREMQEGALDGLFDDLRLARIQDVQLRVPKGEKPFTMTDLFDRVATAVWQNTNAQDANRRTLQRLHLKKMIDVMLSTNEELPHDARALARLILQDCQATATSALAAPDLDRMTRAHFADVNAQIQAALKASVTRDLE